MYYINELYSNKTSTTCIAINSLDWVLLVNIMKGKMYDVLTLRIVQRNNAK